MAVAVAELLSKRVSTPFILDAAFHRALVENGIEALRKNQFINLMEKVCVESEGLEKSPALMNEITAAYDDAHVCGE